MSVSNVLDSSSGNSSLSQVFTLFILNMDSLIFIISLTHPRELSVYKFYNSFYFLLHLKHFILVSRFFILVHLDFFFAHFSDLYNHG